MDNPVLNLQVSSLGELDKALIALREKKIDTSLAAVLNLYGSQILVRHFDLPLISPREIKNALKLEAAEIFSLLPDEIEVDFQVLDSSDKKKRGVFLALPKKIFNQYLARLKKEGIALEKITANIFSRLNYFLYKNKIENKNFCLLDFFKNSLINLAVFTNGKCVLLREIYYEELNNAKEEIIYSLKYAASKSKYKKLDLILTLGDLEDKNNLIQNLEKELNSAVKKYTADIPLDVLPPVSVFDIDLLGRYSFSQSVQKRILSVTNVILLLSLLSLLALGIRIFQQSLQVKKLSASYKAADYIRAKNLQDKINLLKNAQ